MMRIASSETRLNIKMFAHELEVVISEREEATAETKAA
jgi:hypothetical protein